MDSLSLELQGHDLLFLPATNSMDRALPAGVDDLPGLPGPHPCPPVCKEVFFTELQAELGMFAYDFQL